MAELTGRCLCGAVRWSYNGPLTRNLICHCESCQRATSAPFTAFIGMKPEHLKWQGEVNAYQSSEATWRGFCPTCGSRLYFRSDRWPGEIHLHAATLDDPDQYTPDKQVFSGERAPWLDKIEGLPKCEGFDAAPVNSGDNAE